MKTVEDLRQRATAKEELARVHEENETLGGHADVLIKCKRKLREDLG